jgi:hypothetical protein
MLRPMGTAGIPPEGHTVRRAAPPARCGLAGAWFAALALAGAAGCSLAGFFDETPLETCVPGTTETIPCGLCSAGEGLALCLDNGSQELQGCSDPDDLDADHWPNPECAVTRPGCAACTAPFDCNDRDSLVGPSMLETCNGIDDDCNGATDDAFACALGTAVPCTTECGSTGTGTCTGHCEVPAPADCTPPATELCNGRDDTCDTVIDETFRCVVGAPVSCTTTCGWGSIGTCSDECEVPAPADCPPLAEECNGRDDDCDTATDEGC